MGLGFSGVNVTARAIFRVTGVGLLGVSRVMGLGCEWDLDYRLMRV